MTDKKEYTKGMRAAIFCSVLWGVLPLYWQALRPIGSDVIIFYRIFLVGLVCFAASAKIYGIKEVLRPWRDKRLVLRNIAAGLLITFNWSLYIWAVNADFVIQTCIGYYIEPLMVCVFGIVFFKEKLEKYKLISIILAGAGLAVILVHFMQIPFIALGLALSFATYAAIKKTNGLPPLISLFYETVFLMPAALAVIIYLEVSGRGALDTGAPCRYVLLLFCGVLTAVPLGLFGVSAQRVPLTTLGITQYLSPSIALVIGIFVMNEPFDMVQLISFIIIWIGLVFFTMGEIKKDRTTPENDDFFSNFKGYNRFDFPEGIHRVTAGFGGEAILITCCEKTAMIDCGMAYCGQEMIQNTRRYLGERSLDYVFITHTHYDHIGALPYIRREWPDVRVVGSRKAKTVFEREGAVQTIRRLGTEAQHTYSRSREEIPVDGLAVDTVVSEGDRVSLGEQYIYVLEAKGHTDCCLCYILEPMSLMFACESTGVIDEDQTVCSAILKSYDDCIESARKCRAYGARRIITPHFGIIPEFFNKTYFDSFIENAAKEREFVKSMYSEGLSDEEVLQRYKENFWSEARRSVQPEEAFMVNAVNIIRVLKNS